jgi:hypothetical protein
MDASERSGASRRGASGAKGWDQRTLLHHVSVDVLRAGFFSLKKIAAPGVDGLTWTQYEEGLEVSFQNLHARVHGGGYRAVASRRRYIPKADGRRRPLGIAALEDKIVQAAVAAILTPIYEAEFLGFSYGFRPERGTARRAGRARIWAWGSGGSTLSTRISGRSSTRSATHAGAAQKFLSTHAAYNIFNVQRHLTSARTHRTFRAAAMNTWREARYARSSELRIKGAIGPLQC